MLGLTRNVLLFPVWQGKKPEHRLGLISIWGKIMQQSGGGFGRKSMDFPCLPTPLLLEADKHFVNKLWPFSCKSRTSGGLADTVLEKLLLVPSDVTNRGWHLLYLLAAVPCITGAVTLVCLGHAWPTVCERHGSSALCKARASYIVHYGQVLQISPRLQTTQSVADIQYIQYFIGTLDSLGAYWTGYTCCCTGKPVF